MQITEQLRKPVKEVNYLNVENTDRYRPILRFFYLKYERMKYWLYQEDVYEALREDPYFAHYTIEQCQQDLATLAGWGNLVTIQDSKNVRTLEGFKNRRYQYQLSEYTVEIERMVIRLENLLVEGASLEPSLLERMKEALARLPQTPPSARPMAGGRGWRMTSYASTRITRTICAPSTAHEPKN